MNNLIDIFYKFIAVPVFVPTSPDKRKSIEHLSKELLNLSTPPSNRRRSSVPVPKGEAEGQGQTPRRHSAHLEEKRNELGKISEEDEKSPSKYLGQLVDKITQVEPCIVRNALEYQVRDIDINNFIIFLQNDCFFFF